MANEQTTPNHKSKLLTILCKSLQRMALDRGLLAAEDAIDDDLFKELAEADLIQLRKVLHELLYAPPIR